MKTTNFSVAPIARAVTTGLLLLAPVAGFAQETPSDAEIEKIEVKGSLGSLPGQDVEAVFGFGKSILETPRSASTISDEQMERFNVSDIDELVAFAPGTFTQSFFGVAGSLDIRGNPGEAYFRGVKRLDNPGNYPTPIGWSPTASKGHGREHAYHDLLELTIPPSDAQVRILAWVARNLTIRRLEVCSPA